MQPSDDEIIRNIRAGAKERYAHLVQRYSALAYTLSIRMLKNKEDAEEAAQDAFVRAYNGLEKYEGTSKFSTWLYRIVYNVCLTKLGNSTTVFRFVEYDDDVDEYDAQSFTAPDMNYESKEMVTVIKKIVDQMPVKYSTILSLFYFQELSHQEISEVTQLPVATIKTHLYRARLLLQKKLSIEWNIETIV